MNGPTEFYENHHHNHHQYKQQQQEQEQQMLLDKKTTTTTTPTLIRMNGIKPHLAQANNNIKLNGDARGGIKEEEEEKEMTKSHSRNLAKINWWNTPFKPLTIETIVDLQQPVQEEQLLPDPKKDEAATTSVYILEQDDPQENGNSNERKEEENDSLMSNGM